MVKNAPTFREVAKDILQMTEGRIFVAHNVRFDYNFIRSEFRRENIPFLRKQLCTVQLSRKVFPQYKSHSLGNICRDLGIPVDNRHRAFGDAAATSLLLEKIISHDLENIISQHLSLDIKDLNLPLGLAAEKLETLPEEPGIFYLYDEYGNPLFIGKSKNLREHLIQFFQKLQHEKHELHAEIGDIRIELTGSELIAALLETAEIYSLKPKYNRLINKHNFRYGLFSEEDQDGFQKLLVKMLDESSSPLLKFSSKFKADKVMQSILHNFRTDPTFKKLDTHIQYNKRLDDILSRFIYPNRNFFLIDSGRSGTEKSVIMIEEGEYKGFAFFEPSYIENHESLKDIIRRQNELADNKKVILNYIRKNFKNIELISF
jgi:DNA polymerase-3 subunit epsilon